MNSVRKHSKPVFNDKIKHVFKMLLTLMVMSAAIALGTHEMMSDTYAAEQRYITGKTALTTDQFAEEVFRLVNEERAAAGLSAFEPADEDLTDFAYVRAEESVSLYSHTRPSGVKMTTECLAGNFTPERVVYDWMHSDGHRAAIMSEINNAPYWFYPEMAVGVVVDKKTGIVYCSLEFDRDNAPR